MDYAEIRDDRIRSKICTLMSEMLDNPDEHGIYPTSKFMWEMETFILAENERLQKQSDLLTLGLLQSKDRITELEEAINTILNENFSGQSTLSGYAKREAKQALEIKKG